MCTVCFRLTPAVVLELGAAAARLAVLLPNTWSEQQQVCCIAIYAAVTSVMMPVQAGATVGDFGMNDVGGQVWPGACPNLRVLAVLAQMQMQVCAVQAVVSNPASTAAEFPLCNPLCPRFVRPAIACRSSGIPLPGISSVMLLLVLLLITYCCVLIFMGGMGAYC